MEQGSEDRRDAFAGMAVGECVIVHVEARTRGGESREECGGDITGECVCRVWGRSGVADWEWIADADIDL
jgi:hypothetical protein